jgi:benzodiazapine receptor
MTDSVPLNRLNYLNLAFYVLNIVVTYGVGNLGWLAGTTNSELSDKYQALVTPNSSAFSIWSVIFTMQLVFVILQMFPRFRGKKMIQEGVSYYYLLTCAFQAGWTLAFSFEVIWLSVILIVSIWASLVAVLYSQYYTESEGTLIEFWLLRFPFAIHCGWLTAASLLNVNVLVVDMEEPADVQLAVGIISLAILHAVSVWVCFALKRPNYTIAGVLAWANYWIYAELQQPRDQIEARFAADTISGVSYAALAVSIIISSQILIRVIYDVYERCIKKSDKEEVDTDAEEKEQAETEKSHTAANV